MYGGAATSEIARNATMVAVCFSSRQDHSRSLLLPASAAKTQALIAPGPDSSGRSMIFYLNNFDSNQQIDINLTIVSDQRHSIRARNWEFMMFGMGIGRPITRLFDHSKTSVPFGTNADGIDVIKIILGAWCLPQIHQALSPNGSAFQQLGKS